MLRRLHACGADAISDALLNQRVLAGVGNVLKSETLFVAGIAPFTPVARLADVDLERVVDIARDQLRANAMEPSQTLTRSIGRRTTRSMDPNAKLYVYGRGGKPCRRCGAIVQARKTGLGLAILVPGFPRLKEWAYAGILFELTGAAVANAAMGGSIGAEWWHVPAPLVVAALGVASWALRPPSRRRPGPAL